MMRILINLCIAVVLLSTFGCKNGGGTPGSAKTLDISDLLMGYDSETNPYSDPAMWLSGPDAAEDFVLSVDLDTTVVHSDLSTEVVHVERPQNPDLDIFYIHPTVNLDGVSGNDDLSDLTNTKNFVKESIARFSTIGRVIAPLYHSGTAGCFLTEDKEILNNCLKVAYEDVESAFKYYLANTWNGEKLAIMGYSQGALMTRMLLQDFVADHPALMSRIVVVIPMSGDLEINSFENIPACEENDQAGCYISYHAFMDEAPPQAGTLIGDWSDAQGACTDVAGAAGEAGILTMSYFSMPTIPGALPTDALAYIPLEIKTPYMAFPAFYKAKCIAKDDTHYLRVEQANPAVDQRWSPIDYYHTFTVTDAPFGLGLHLFDWSIAMSDLLYLVEYKAAQLEGNEKFLVVK